MTDKMELLKRTKLFVLDMVCALTIALIDLAFQIGRASCRERV